MIVTHLVLPDGLGTQLAKISLRGQLRGRVAEDESLFVAFEGVGELPREDVEISDEEDADLGSIRVPATRRIFNHWMFSRLEASMARLTFVVVKPGFERALRSKEVATAADTALWTQDGKPIGALEASQNNWSVCVLEQEGDIVRSILVICLSGRNFYREEIDVIPGEPQMPTRMDGLAPVQSLRTQRVAVIGVGSGGSMTTLALAAAGVGTIHLFDHDRISVDNVFRHACNINQVGRAKVLAMRDLVADHQLPTLIVPHETNVVENTTRLWETMNEVDLVICATDNTPSRRLANYLCVRTNTTLLLGCAFHNAQIGEIIRVRPGVSACYECTRAYLRSIGALIALSAKEAEAENVSYDSQTTSSGASTTENIGTRVDVSLIASLLAKAAMTTLLSHNRDGEADLPSDYLAWGVNASQEFPAPYSFDLPFSVNWMKIPRQNNCLVCADVGEPHDDEIEGLYAHIMENLSRQDDADAEAPAEN